jgi:hypothetical protein
MKKISIAIGCVLFLGCAPGVDLKPDPDTRPGFGFCRQMETGPDKGKLIVVVKNVGKEASPASVTKVAFSPGGTVDLPTPAVAPGASTQLGPIEFPASCHNPDCNFRIDVDAESTIKESNESNNTGDGHCIG